MKTSRILPVALFFIFSSLVSSAFAQAKPVSRLEVKVQELDLFDESRQRPVKLTLWYPAAKSCTEAEFCLNPKAKLDQTVVFSHGAMGAAKGYNWIGYAMASQGLVVAGINHYGESWVYGREQIDPRAAIKVWHRPLDVSFALERLLKNKLKANKIFDKAPNWNNVTAVGHSSGAATVLALSGAEWQLEKATEYCTKVSFKKDRSCGYMQHKDSHFQLDEYATDSYIDHKIKRVIALDPALGHVTSHSSLAQITTPVLVIASKQNDFLNFEQHGAFYLKHLANSQQVILDKGEGHFVYLDECTHKHQAMGIAICEDRQEVNRKEVHQSLYPHLFSFLYQ